MYSTIGLVEREIIVRSYYLKNIYTILIASTIFLRTKEKSCNFMTIYNIF